MQDRRKISCVAPVHATIFKQDHPADVADSIYFVFERINTGGIRLSPQEIRNCVSLGPFIEMVKKLNNTPSWRNVFASTNNRSKDEELIVRFLAIYLDGEAYVRPMNKFLNDFSSKTNRVSEPKLKQYGEIFVHTINVVQESISRPFRLVRSLNAAVFDSVMVGLATRIETGGLALDTAAVQTAYNNLLADPTYRLACESSTSLEENVRQRRTLAIRAFAAV